MALDLYRTAAQIDAAVAGADLGAARDRRTDAVLAALRVADGAGAYVEMRERILAHLREHGAITVEDVRDAFGTSRKYALPLLEYLDQQHITGRQGDQRVLLRDPGRS